MGLGLSNSIPGHSRGKELGIFKGLKSKAGVVKPGGKGGRIRPIKQGEVSTKWAKGIQAYFIGINPILAGSTDYSSDGGNRLNTNDPRQFQANSAEAKDKILNPEEDKRRCQAKSTFG